MFECFIGRGGWKTGVTVGCFFVEIPSNSPLPGMYAKNMVTHGIKIFYTYKFAAWFLRCLVCWAPNCLERKTTTPSRPKKTSSHYLVRRCPTVLKRYDWNTGRGLGI